MDYSYECACVHEHLFADVLMCTCEGKYACMCASPDHSRNSRPAITLIPLEWDAHPRLHHLPSGSIQLRFHGSQAHQALASTPPPSIFHGLSSPSSPPLTYSRRKPLSLPRVPIRSHSPPILISHTCKLLGTDPSVWQPSPSGTLSQQRSATLWHRHQHNWKGTGSHFCRPQQCLPSLYSVLYYFVLPCVKVPWVP